jgi:3-oxoacyl-[acyl-carrier-protein] synthase-3
MSGKEVFKIAVVKMAETARKALELAGKKDEDVALYIPHQANLRIIEAVGKRLGVAKEKVYVNVHKYGNMSAATTIIALDEAISSGAAKKGDIITVMAFGGGLTWGPRCLKYKKNHKNRILEKFIP